MAASNLPVYATIPHSAGVVISTANTNRDGTGTIGTVVTAANGGTRVARVNIKALVTTTAGMIRFYRYDGSTYYPYKERVVTAVTVGASTAAFEDEFTTPDLVLPPGWSLRASTHNAESFCITVDSPDYAS